MLPIKAAASLTEKLKRRKLKQPGQKALPKRVPVQPALNLKPALKQPTASGTKANGKMLNLKIE